MCLQNMDVVPLCTVRKKLGQCKSANRCLKRGQRHLHDKHKCMHSSTHRQAS